MDHRQIGLLTESIYDAAVEPGGWSGVMALLKDCLRTGAETFYYLDYGRHRMRPVHVDGISDFYYGCFEDRFFTDDNPCIHAEPLHRAGVVRTDERLVDYFRDPQILRRSQYYNDWMRPQQLEHSMGTTVLSEGGVVVNLSLLRSAEVGRFRAEEVEAFAGVCRHLQRAVRVALRLETVAADRRLTLDALDCLPFGTAFLDVQGRVIGCNAIAEALIRNGDGLSVKGGRLMAVGPGEQRKFVAFLRQFAHAPASSEDLGPACVSIGRDSGQQPLVLSAIRLSGQQRVFSSTRSTVLLLIADPALNPPADLEFIRERYRLTAMEARLAQVLSTGENMKRAAEALGITYETARWYLKILFQKTGTNRQAELVARLLCDMAVPVQRRRRASGRADASPRLSN